MPTYQYACRSCDHRFEAVQGFHEQALQVCPECEAEDVRKLFGNVGVVFKGPGFYRTDSRSGKTGAGSSGAKSAANAGTDGGKASSKSGASSSGASGSGATGTSASGSGATGTAAKSTGASSTPSAS